MKLSVGVGVLLLAGHIGGMGAAAQPGQATGRPPVPQEPATVASTLDFQLSVVERETESLAEAMPENKYSFVPTIGNFEGSRTFAQQVKHLAAQNNRYFDSILGNAAPAVPDEGVGSNGPDSIQTKDQIVQYLKDSFAKGHKAIATIDSSNSLTPLKNPVAPSLRTRLALAIFACMHGMDHHGQMAVYLRAVGQVPPGSPRHPAANPSAPVKQ